MFNPYFLFSIKLNVIRLVRHEMRQHLSALIDMTISMLIMEHESDVLTDISIYRYFHNDLTATTVETVIEPTEMNDLNVQQDSI